MKKIILYVDEEDNERLDLYLAKELDEISRTYIQNLIKDGRVLVSGQKKKPRYLIKEGDLISVELPDPKELEIIAENIYIDIVYEDKDIVIVNKGQDMVVHPAPGNYTGTLVNALLYHVRDLSSINGIIRPGIIHRLDKDTSGLLVIAKNDYSHKFISDQFKSRTVKREYIALVDGKLKNSRGIINEPIGRNPNDRKKMVVTNLNSKEAITEYRVIQYFNNYTLVNLVLRTGRTHQIRVHLQHINHSIVGDPTYGKPKNKFGLKGQLLHASKLGFLHPKTKNYIEFNTKLPDRFISNMEMID